MASKLQPHIQTIIKLRKQQMNFSQIADHLTAMGIPTKRQTLIKFYRRASKNAQKIEREVGPMERLFVDQQQQPKTVPAAKNLEVEKLESESNANSDADKWKPKVIRPPAGWKPKPKVEPQHDPMDDFKIGPDVLR